jgi:hypothetical protein
MTFDENGADREAAKVGRLFSLPISDCQLPIMADRNREIGNRQSAIVNWQ